MSPAAFHIAILRSAATLVPEPRRTDWLAEWRSELWHVRRDSSRRNVAAFCLGAFRDAFWLRRNSSILRSHVVLNIGSPATPEGIESFPDQGEPALASPAQCLSWLTALSAFCVVLALLLPAVRHALTHSPIPGNLVMLAPAGQPGSSISLQQFEALKVQYEGEFNGIAFYVSMPLPVETAHGRRTLSVARTTPDLFRVLNISVPGGKSAAPALLPTPAVWRRDFNSDARIPVADIRWNLPAGVDAWLIEDEMAIAALPASTSGFAVGRLRYTALSDSQFRTVQLEQRSFEFLSSMTALLTMYMLVALVTSRLASGRPRRVGPRRGLFLAAKILLVLPIVVFGSLDLASLGGSVSPVVADIGFFGAVFAARWIAADQNERCPVCLRLLSNPVRIGESSRILLEWHGTELMCLRGHGMLYVPEWPAIWSARQRWMDLDPSWTTLCPDPAVSHNKL